MADKIQIAQPKHEVLYQELVDLLKKHADELDSLEMLAIAANMLGKLVAMQDQRKVTSDMGMEVVGKNIELGNRQVLKQLANTKGSG